MTSGEETPNPCEGMEVYPPPSAPYGGKGIIHAGTVDRDTEGALERHGMLLCFFHESKVLQHLSTDRGMSANQLICGPLHEKVLAVGETEVVSRIVYPVHGEPQPHISHGPRLESYFHARESTRHLGVRSGSPDCDVMHAGMRKIRWSVHPCVRIGKKGATPRKPCRQRMQGGIFAGPAGGVGGALKQMTRSPNERMISSVQSTELSLAMINSKLDNPVPGWRQYTGEYCFLRSARELFLKRQRQSAMSAEAPEGRITRNGMKRAKGNERLRSQTKAITRRPRRRDLKDISSWKGIVAHGNAKSKAEAFRF